MLYRVVFIFIFSGLVACTSNFGILQPQGIDVFSGVSQSGFTYDVWLNAVRIEGADHRNVYEISRSSDGNYVIFSKVEKGRQPELWLISGRSKALRLTYNESIEFSPVVNNRGDFAYALHELSTSESKLFLNNQEVRAITQVNSRGLFKHPAINDRYLAVVYERLYDHCHQVLIYDIQLKILTKISIGYYVESLDFIQEDMLVMTAFDQSVMSSGVYLINIKTGRVKTVINTEAREYVHGLNFNTDFTIRAINSESRDAVLAAYALYEWKTSQFSNPFASTNDFLGRLSWNQFYRNNGLIKLWKMTQSETIKQQINYCVEQALGVRNKYIGVSQDKYNAPKLWSSKKYSIGKSTPISFMANNASILYSLLLDANSGVLHDDLVAQIKDTAESMYTYFENYYLSEKDHYIFQKGMAFWADGVVLPYNMQNMFGLVLIELYRLTGNDVYRNRLIDLSQKFKSEFEYTDDGRLLWHYWPKEFYQGWSEEDQISVNTPSLQPRVDKLYEDISHAGINTKFILEFRKQFGEIVFTDEEISRLQKTVDNFIYDNRVSRFMSGDTDYQAPDIQFLATYGWPELGNKVYNQLLLKRPPKIYPDFDSERMHAYLDLMSEGSEFGEIKIPVTEIKYGIDGHTLSRKSYDMTPGEYAR